MYTHKNYDWTLIYITISMVGLIMLIFGLLTGDLPLLILGILILLCRAINNLIHNLKENDFEQRQFYLNKKYIY
jgi:hypothetical protein